MTAVILDVSVRAMASPPNGAPRWHTREDSGLRLDRQLRWWHDGEPIEHPKIIDAFNRGLRPSGDGRFRLEFGNDWCFVEVEDAAYAVVGLEHLSDQLLVRLGDGTSEPMVLPSLAIGPDGVLTCRVKAGQAKARFSRDAQFALGLLLEPTPDGFLLRVGGGEVRIRSDSPSS